MKRFVSWAAVSSLPQAKKISLEDQLLTNREHIAKWHGKLVEELIVPGESREIILFEEAAAKMEAYARLKELIDKKAFDVLIFLNHSRLGREDSLVLSVLRLCQRAGIITYSVESAPTTLDQPQNSHSDSLLDAIKAVGAQQEISEMRRRHHIGMIGRIKRGDFPSTPPWPWEIKYDEKGAITIVVNDAQKDVLLLLFSLFMEHGRSYRQIADDLNSRSYLSPRGGQWGKETVAYMIAIAYRYAGQTEINRRSKTREHIKGQSRWPSIISMERAATIEAERLRRRASNGAPPSISRFTQVIWCATCGRPCGGTVSVSKNKYHYPIYRCHSNHSGRFIMAHRVEAAARAAIEYIRSIDDLSKFAPEMQDRTALLQAQMDQLNKQLSDLRTQLERADDAFTAGIMKADRYQRQVERVEGQIADVNEKIESLTNIMLEEHRSGSRLDRLQEIANDGLTMLEHEDIQFANAWFRKHMRIWMKDSTITDVDYI